MSERIAIIGGGLAGSIAALHLARAGRQVILLEKSKGPQQKVCGEFLSYEALHYLDGANIDVDLLGAVAISRVRLIGNGFQTEAALPFPARSLSRHVLDEALLQRAAAAGAQIERGIHVQGVTAQKDEWHVRVRNGAPLTADTVVLATGKHDLRGLPRPAGTHPGLVGFKMLFRLHPQQQQELGDAVELILFPGGYAGLQPVENGAANLCLLVTARQLKRCGGTWTGLLDHLRKTAPHLAGRLAGAEPLLPVPLTVASIPYGFVQRTAPDGLWRVGDQAAVIPSFSGDGMAIALHSGSLAARCMLAGEPANDFQRTLAKQLRTRITFATTLSRTLVNQPWTASATRLWPGMLPCIATATRIAAALLVPHQTPVSRGACSSG